MTTPWHAGWRDAVPALLAQEWDLLIIGGGITGAGILLEASRRGLKALLVEQRDFAWGTSSRSSKLVHGGLRYLKEGKFALTRESVHERQALLRDAPGLVEPQRFAFADYKGRKPGRKAFLVGLAIYDFMAGRRERHYESSGDFAMMAPNIGRDGLQGGMCYTDAKTDDARLVLRVLQEAQTHGGVALNYVAAQALLRDDHGQVTGARVRVDALMSAREGENISAGRSCGDGVPAEMSATVRARVVINATGAWADTVRGKAGGGGTRLRPLRGSHLVLPAWRLPLAQAISLMHPQDGRPVFAFPWEGVTLVGTTDVDHAADLHNEASITRAETDYLMAALHVQFPQLGLVDADIIATYAGVRPVIDSGAADPSKEGRDHAVWIDDGLLTVTGGKLTTFRVIALDALRHAQPLLPGWHDALLPLPVFAPSPPLDAKATTAATGASALAGPSAAAALNPTQRQRLQGRYGAHASALLAAAQPGELATIPGTETLWAELRWAARAEAVLRLEDLLLRRTRLGLQLRGGGAQHLERIRAICQPELGWTDARWQASEAAYLTLWTTHYSVPENHA